jgi:WD40 repeat protein
MACTPQGTQELNVTPNNVLVQTRTTNATLGSPALATSTPTESVTVMPLPTISNTSTPVSMLVPTEAVISTPSPAVIYSPLTYQGTILLSIAPNIEINESTLWFLSPPYVEAQQLLAEEGVLFSEPLLSPTGRYVAYQRYVSDSTSIWILDMTTGETRQWSEEFRIVSMELQGYPHFLNGIVIQSWSPDETALVYQYWEEQVALDEPIWSYILFEDGHSEQLGSRVQDVSWSASEPNKLVYLSEFEGIYLVDINRIETSTQLLQEVDVANGSLSWHPDGQLIALAGNQRNNVPLWMLDLSTKRLTIIKGGEFGDQLVRWSPDGKFLFWLSNVLSEILSFQGNIFTQPVSVQPLPSSVKSRENPWLQDSNYLGLLLTTPNNSGIDLCFYSILGKRVSCPLETHEIVSQLSLDETSLVLSITWAP